MNHLFKSSARPVLGLSSVLLAVALAGCNKGATSGTSTSTGANGDTIATVGTSKVTRADLADFLISQSGEQALPYLIDTQLLTESLKAKGMEVSDAEVDADLARRQEADPSIATLVSAGGSKLDSAKRQIKRDLTIQKLLTADVKMSDAQVKAFYTKYHTYYDAPAKIKTGLLFASSKVRADLLANQLKAKTKTFEQLVAEQKAAKDPVAGQSTADTGRFDALTSYPPTILPQLEKMAKGDVTTPQQINVGLPTPVFAIFRKVDFQPAKKADLTALKAQLEMDYKLAEVARKAVVENKKNPPFDTTLKKTEVYLQNQNPGGTAPRLHDVLSFINQTASNVLLSKLRTGGTVQVDDPTFATVAQQYQASPATTGGATNSVDTGAASTGTASTGTASTTPTTIPAANDTDKAPNGADQEAPAAVKK